MNKHDTSTNVILLRKDMHTHIPVPINLVAIATEAVYRNCYSMIVPMDHFMRFARSKSVHTLLQATCHRQREKEAHSLVALWNR